MTVIAYTQYWAICRPPSLIGAGQQKTYRCVRNYLTTTIIHGFGVWLSICESFDTPIRSIFESHDRLPYKQLI
jgi:hypothetical protein